jgi:hemolysin III
MTAAASAPVLDRHGNPKPRMRGWIHRFASFVALPAAILAGRSGADRPRADRVRDLRHHAGGPVHDQLDVPHRELDRSAAELVAARADHSMIFLLIAGTYTAVLLLVMHGTLALVELAIVWAGALAGVGVKLWRTDLHVVSGFMYIGLGWVAAVSFPAMIRALDVPNTILLVSGG